MMPFLLLVETVGQRRGSRLVYQPQDFKSGDAAGIFGGLALGIVEICGNGDDGFCDRPPKEALGVALELAQDEARKFPEGCKSCSPSLMRNTSPGMQIVRQAEGKQLQLFLNVLNAAPHQAFDGVDRALGVSIRYLRAALPTMI